MEDYSEFRPISRRDELIIEELPGELLIYDLRTHRAHCLNGPAAAIYLGCDGTRTVAELALSLTGTHGLPCASQLVLLGLRRLQQADLLQSGSRLKFNNQITRRALVRRIATGTAATLLIPLITTVPVQAAAHVASCVPEGVCIQGVNDCAPCFNGSEGPDKNQCKNKRCWHGRCRPDHQTPCV